MTIDELLMEIQEITEQMEQGGQSLEEALKSYETGIRLIRECSMQIEQVEKKIQMIQDGGEKENYEK